MGEIRTPAKVKIIVGILAKDAKSVEAVRGVLKSRFGEEDLNLEPFPFTFTNYYKEEIGEAPVRAFFSYENLVDRETIVDIKLWTNDIELEIAKENGTPGLRPVNLDPGYMTLGQFFFGNDQGSTPTRLHAARDFRGADALFPGRALSRFRLDVSRLPKRELHQVSRRGAQAPRLPNDHRKTV